MLAETHGLVWLLAHTRRLSLCGHGIGKLVIIGPEWLWGHHHL